MKTRTVALVVFTTVVVAGSAGFLGARWLDESEPQAVTSSPAPQPSETDVDEASLAINGFGPIRVGMTLAEASESTRREITIAYDSGRNCAYAEPRGGPEGLRFMVIDGEIVRIDIHSPSLTTLSGIHNGSGESEVYDAYPGRIRRERHPYDQGGSYLIYEPKDASDQEYLMIFETDGAVVTSFRSGFKQPVSFIEGCS